MALKRAHLADTGSTDLLQRARQSLQKVQDDLEPRLNASAGKVQKISAVNNATEHQLKDINKLIDQLPAESQRICGRIQMPMPVMLWRY